MLQQSEKGNIPSLVTDTDENVSEELSLAKRERSNTWQKRKKTAIKLLEESYFFVDSANLANGSGLKLLVDIIKPDDDQAFKDTISSPAGISSMLILTGFLSTMALLGARKNANDSLLTVEKLQLINTIYKDVRELMQSAKYAYKSSRLLFKLVKQLGGMKLPLDIMLMVITPFVIITRISVRHFRDKRKEMQDYNENLLKMLESRQSSDQDARKWEMVLSIQNREKIEEQYWLDKIRHENKILRYTALTTVAINAALDGIYNYVGLLFFLPLTALSPFSLIFLVTISLCYALILTMSRTMEEYQQQNKMEVSALNCELQIEIDNNYMLYLASIDPDVDNETRKKITKLQEQSTKRCVELFDRKKALGSSEYMGGALQGIRKGLAVMSIMGAGTALIGVLLGFFGLAMPPVLPLIVLMMGMACLVGGMVYYVAPLLKEDIKDFFDEKVPLLESLEESGLASPLSQKASLQFEAPVKKKVPEPPQLDYMVKEPVYLPLTGRFGAFETIRSLTSGFSKSFKLTSQYQNSTVMLVISLCYAFCSALIHGVNGHKKNSGGGGERAKKSKESQEKAEENNTKKLPKLSDAGFFQRPVIEDEGAECTVPPDNCPADNLFEDFPMLDELSM